MRLRLIKKRAKKVGLPPGTPVYVGEKKFEKFKITIIDYDEKQFQEKKVESVFSDHGKAGGRDRRP